MHISSPGALTASPGRPVREYEHTPRRFQRLQMQLLILPAAAHADASTRLSHEASFPISPIEGGFSDAGGCNLNRAFDETVWVVTLLNRVVVGPQRGIHS